jgi:hypothetical protein
MSDQIADQVRAVQGGLNVDQPWQTRRVPDAIRAAALANAVDAINALMPGTNMTVERVLETARTFEAYLTGEEAHDPTNP